MKKYFFYTDPSILKVQTTDQAFGPASKEDGNDLYRISDLHIAKTMANNKAPAAEVYINTFKTIFIK